MAKKAKKQQNLPELSGTQIQTVRTAAERLAKAHQLEVHDVTFGPTDFGLTLSVFIKAASGGKPVSVSDCEVISRPLSKELDELLQDFAEGYLFEVTSVGVEEKTE